MILGEKLKIAIKDAGFSVAEVAQDAGMSEQNLYKVFKKDSIQSDVLERICRKIGIPVTHFFDPGVTQTPQGNSHNVTHQKGGTINQTISIGEKECLQQLLAAKEKIIELQNTVIELKSRK